MNNPIKIVIFLIAFLNFHSITNARLSNKAEDSQNEFEINQEINGSSEEEDEAASSTEEMDNNDGGCCEGGWAQFEDKCYKAYAGPFAADKANYVCYEQEGFVYPVSDFRSAGEHRFLSAKFDLKKFWPVHQTTFDKKYGTICRRDVARNCPGMKYLLKRVAEFDEITAAQKATGKRCCQKDWTLIQGLCIRTFAEAIKFYEEPIKCEKYGSKPISVSNAAVDKYIGKKLGTSNRYVRQDYGTEMQQGFACMQISMDCAGGQKKKAD